MKNLSQLIVRDSQVKSVSENAFDGLSKLETLDLSYNQIGSLGKGTFKDLHALRELYLQGGLLQNIEEKSFDSCKTLHKLHLQSNRLTSLPKDLLSPLKSTLKQLGLTGNPWACDCYIVPLATWLKENQQFPIICASPAELKGNTSNEIELTNLPCTSTLHQHLVQLAPIVIPIVVLLVLAGLGVFFFLRWRKHREGDTTVKYRRTEDSFHLGDVIEDNDVGVLEVGDRSRLEFNSFDKNTQSLVNDTADEEDNREEDAEEDEDDDETKRLSNDFGNHVGEATC
ncbi:leucine-rich repeat-containing protein 26-like [Branchiostoma lanceolatum]|uniref:leucine-rich repeat-containing protein 26-like n=1 Tax=Branchiostoma lanceolatum TaxID=7740 RepID=UPI0034555389